MAERLFYESADLGLHYWWVQPPQLVFLISTRDAHVACLGVPWEEAAATTSVTPELAAVRPRSDPEPMTIAS